MASAALSLRSADLKDLCNYLGPQPKGEKKKRELFSPSKTGLKITSWLSLLCHITASSKLLQLNYVPTPENAVHPLKYWSANDSTVI